MPVNYDGDHERLRDATTAQAILDAAVRDALTVEPDSGFFCPSKDLKWLDIGYAGMDEDEAVRTAESDGISEIRVFHLPFRSAYRLDYKPERLNLAIAAGSVIRAAFF